MTAAIIYSTILILAVAAASYGVYRVYADGVKEREYIAARLEESRRLEAEYFRIKDEIARAKAREKLLEEKKANGQLVNPFAEPREDDDEDEMGYDPFNGMRAIEASDSEAEEEEDQR